MLKCYKNDYQITPYKITPKRSSSEAYALLKKDTLRLRPDESASAYTDRQVSSHMPRFPTDTRNGIFHTVEYPPAEGDNKK